MTRRADPERIHLARRAAVRNRLTGEGMSEELAEHWCDAWEAEAARRKLERLSPDYWREGTAWIYAERPARKAP